MDTTVTCIILAAGKGSRMNSQKPKVLQPIGGRSMIGHVLQTATQVSQQQIVVIGNQADQVRQHIQSEVNQPPLFAYQKKQLGTAHAVQIATSLLPSVDENGLDNQGKLAKVLILYGDVPLVKATTLMKMISLSDPHPIVLLSANMADATGYGRIVRDETGAVMRIVEHRDADQQQLGIAEINSGIMLVHQHRLQQWLPQIINSNHHSNQQREYYLPDIVTCCVQQGGSVSALCLDDSSQINGVNSQRQRVQQERTYQQQIINQLVEQGLGVADMNRLDIRGSLSIGCDVFFDINVIISGNVDLGNNVMVGPGCVIRNCSIGSNCIIKPYSNLEDSIIGDDCIIGPYARLRPGTRLKSKVQIGNFVETKKSTIEADSKINHLSYVGDSRVGQRVNVGAGTITCNYDGINKHPTDIDDDAFIGSGSQLIAPVRIGKKAVIGAGSVVQRDVKDKSLFVSRPQAVEKTDWGRRKKPQ